MDGLEPSERKEERKKMEMAKAKLGPLCKVVEGDLGKMWSDSVVSQRKL